jgi:hypothetical protein
MLRNKRSFPYETFPVCRLAAAGILLFALLAGCVSKQQAVYVDLATVTQADTILDIRVPTTAAGTPSFAGSTLSLPALPSTIYTHGSDKERIKEVQDVLQRSRETAFRQIATNLRDTYISSIRQAEAKELEKLSPSDQTAYTNAFSQTNALFRTYADQRGKLLVELSLLAGFPDLDPQSQRTAPKGNNAVAHRFEKAKGLRGQLNALDADYRGKATAYYTAAKGEIAASLLRVQEQTKQAEAAADARAISEAQQEVKREQAHLTSVLAEKGTVAFPAEPGRTVTVQTSQKPAPPPTVSVAGKADILERLKIEEQSDLKIWAGINGYVISSDRRGVRDETAAFMAWRKQHLVSR